MRITYDKAADAAYVYLVRVVGPGEVARTIPGNPLQEMHVNFDLDNNGHIIGIEILGASKVLSQETLSRAETNS